MKIENDRKQYDNANKDNVTKFYYRLILPLLQCL